MTEGHPVSPPSPRSGAVTGRLAGPAMAIAGGLLLLLLTLLVASGTLAGLDARWLEQIAGTAGHRALAFAGWITWLGSSRYVHPGVLLAALLLWRRGLRDPAVVLATSCYAASATTFLLKRLVGRERPVPPEELLSWLPASPAFPSGHATNATVLALFLLWLASRTDSPPLKLAAVLAIPPALLVLWSRLALQVHWPSDVLGGALVALLWTGLAVSICSVSQGHASAGK